MTNSLLGQGFLRRPVEYDGKLDIHDDQPVHVHYYEQEYLNINPSLHSEDVEAKLSAIASCVSRIRSVAKISIVGDIGCGSGQLCLRLLERFFSSAGDDTLAIGVDVSKNILSRAVRHPKFIKFRADCTDTPFRSAVISLCICMDIIEHIRNPEDVLKEVSRISEFAIFKIPIELSLYTSLRGGERRLSLLEQRYGHVKHFNREAILALVSNHFEILSEHYEKIPDRSRLVDYLQNMLLRIGCNRVYAFCFGGFIILSAKSKLANIGSDDSPATT